MFAESQAADLAETMTDAVNGSVDSDEFVAAVGREHRYLQGSVFDQLVRPLICEYARMAESGTYDERNERQVKTCKEIADQMNWMY